jgi:hypothetical protein
MAISLTLFYGSPNAHNGAAASLGPEVIEANYGTGEQLRNPVPQVIGLFDDAFSTRSASLSGAPVASKRRIGSRHFDARCIGNCIGLFL